MEIREVRDSFERFLVQCITRWRKEMLGRGPKNLHICICKHYLIIELEDFAENPMQRFQEQFWDSIEYLENCIDSRHGRKLNRFLEILIDIKIVGKCSTLIQETKTKSIILIADRPWDNAEVRLDFRELNVPKLLENILLADELE